MLEKQFKRRSRAIADFLSCSCDRDVRLVMDVYNDAWNDHDLDAIANEARELDAAFESLGKGGATRVVALNLYYRNGDFTASRAYLERAAADVLVLLTCFTLTVVFDMVISVTVGVMLAALLFMRRMAEVSGVRLVDQHPLLAGLPKSVLVYEVAGPLFFGAAQKAMSALHRVPTGIKVVLLDLSSVPAMDATGLVSLETAVERLEALGVSVVLAGVQSQPLRVLAKSGLSRRSEHVEVYQKMERAVAAARQRAEPRPAVPY